MSVATMLGVDNVDAPTMMEARRSWQDWTAQEPALAVVDDLLDLPNWTRTAGREPKDAAMRSLAKLGSATGSNDPVATTALTWALIPGAATIAYRLSDLANNVDELVASHLWTSAKTFEWERRRSTAASILRDTRRGVLAELGVGEWARREDHTWSETVCVEPASPAWQHFADDSGDNAMTELLDLLEGATRAGVISRADRALLFDLAIAADMAGVPAGRGRAGLTGPAASEVVASQLGLIPRSVTRRASSSIDRLIAFTNDCRKEGSGAVSTQPALLALGA